MDFEKLRSDPRVAYLLGVGIGVALGLVIAARLRPQETLWERAQKPCPECERSKVERAIEEVKARYRSSVPDPGDGIDED